MRTAIIFPGKYVQGRGELKNLGRYCKNLGEQFLVLISESGMKRVKEIVDDSVKAAGKTVEYVIFNGECSHKEINRLNELCKEKGLRGVIGIGGGKILDTAKAVAHAQNGPVVIVPTIASTDAPTSALSVIYTDEGAFSKFMILPKNPDVVIMDTDIISKAPSRLLVAGMGDALATYFEARSAKVSGAKSLAGGRPTLAAMALAELCLKTLLDNGTKARAAVSRGVCTPAVEAIVEANTLLSGIGFESGGVSAAHSIHNGFAVLPHCNHLYHGEKVAFGVITQLVMENANTSEITEIIKFCNQVGLPTTLKAMGIEEIKEDEIMAVAKAASADGEVIHSMPFPVTPDTVYAAILAADAMGQLLDLS